MPIKIDYSFFGKNLSIEIMHDDVTELPLAEKIYYKILENLFLNRPIVIITKQPQVYSFANGLGGERYFSIDKKKVLINKIDKANDALLKSISQEEEFKRGLLIVVHSPRDFSENELKLILDCINNTRSELTSTIAFVSCEDDGNTIRLYNFNSAIENVKILVNSILSSDCGNVSH